MVAMQQVSSGVTSLESAVSQYKQAIDQYEDTIETLQDNIDSTYNSYSQAVTSTNISNGELREEQKKVSENSIAAAQLSIDQAEESLDAYTITATISGVIETVNIKEHDYATSSSYAFVISNKDTMIATYYVSEDVRNTFSVGQSIILEKDDNTYEGEVVEIGSAIDQTTGLFKIKAAVMGGSEGLLSGTKATVITDTYHENNAVIIPYDAVYYDGSQAYVYTVVDGKAKRTNIETGLYDNENIVVTSGLSEKDMVITTWAAELRDGVDVEIKNTQE
jgi:RND family efflux transporter MFP subunit